MKDLPQNLNLLRLWLLDYLLGSEGVEVGYQGVKGTSLQPSNVNIPGVILSQQVPTTCNDYEDMT